MEEIRIIKPQTPEVVSADQVAFPIGGMGLEAYVDPRVPVSVKADLSVAELRTFCQGLLSASYALTREVDRLRRALGLEPWTIGAKKPPGEARTQERDRSEA